MKKNDYYVYVYIDPRNYEEFYYGKGKGSRKEAHLFDRADSEKTKCISQIRRSGLEPTIRTIAANLTEQEALLIEATLLWKLGKWTTNITGGYFSNNFRPANTLYMELPGFDFSNRIYHFNVGEGNSRNWEDCRKYGFIAAGGGPRWRDAILGLRPGDIVFAFLSGYGYVGIGKVVETARMARDIHIGKKRLLDINLVAEHMNHNSDSSTYSEYVAKVKWIKSVPRGEAKWKKNAGLLRSQLVRVALDYQPRTLNFVQREFDVDLSKIAD
ncbi:MAG: hypothetical protein COV30_00610 [Candidatus Yanofskybacteria bacterium CG10_big_fil_rev_8_21_14_0_10_37_15]|uniref:GIY-YIG domain-containing protein n=1 Tax=Candidatus Yanofskybacteria bacterium CG10_big_fil_rev_8_21_14_0_10_37_15 TaxID=1975097 RepID=A0A2H0R7K0_9BACT|nr:MAG: hypothetical protein COV30_00610 [Candidatus Yanofskybacteria bacterium CG10_big_fil_rev_8_21_14_0_10_37_15]